ncbi:hypothetical protein R9C00_18905 [Flammeovirgaceae bacterium SG7u.111]|nr:hypothetical protein [Flammeovirgaceae bacterium SG7u.132]WPO33771.1 hypothetical protein R9C00_18905 [Flammeovirgaceae bacterium SG7u.111]
MEIYITSNGEMVNLPQGFDLKIDELSNGVYEINISDKNGRSVSGQCTDTELDSLVQKAIESLKKVRGYISDTK